MYAYLKRAFEVSQLSTCVSRKVGAIIPCEEEMDLCGFNEMPGGACGEEKICRCFDPHRIPGKDLDKCFAAHAEARVIGLAAKHGIALQGRSIYVTDLPCNECAKLIAEAGIQKVIYAREYPESRAKEILDRAGVFYQQVMEWNS